MEKHRNIFKFTPAKQKGITSVELDLTVYTAELFKEGILPMFEIWVMLGTRTERNGRVIYRFNTPNVYAKVLESAIVNARLKMQGQNN